MEQYVPCPVCESSWAQHTDPSEKSDSVQYFDMEDCVLTAIERDFISCPRHPDLPVPLQELVPELFMTDFPARYATMPHRTAIHPQWGASAATASCPIMGSSGSHPRLPEGNQVWAFWF